MTEFTFHFSLAMDFSGGINSAQLQAEIIVGVGALSSILRIDTNADDVAIVFSSDLSESERDALAAAISTHVPSQLEMRPLANLITRTNKFNETEWIRIITCVYSGTHNTRPIRQVDILAKMDADATSYSLRCLNLDAASTAPILFEETFNNTTDRVVMIGGTSLSNIPTDKATLEFQVKKTGGSKKDFVYVESITLFS